MTINSGRQVCIACCSRQLLKTDSVRKSVRIAQTVRLLCGRCGAQYTEGHEGVGEREMDKPNMQAVMRRIIKLHSIPDCFRSTPLVLWYAVGRVGILFENLLCREQMVKAHRRRALVKWSRNRGCSEVNSSPLRCTVRKNISRNIYLNSLSAHFRFFCQRRQQLNFSFVLHRHIHNDNYRRGEIACERK